MRGVLLIALLASIAIRFESIRSRNSIATEFDIGAAIANVVRESGSALRENPIKPPRVLSSAIYFQRPECREASIAMPFSLNYEALPYLARAMGPEFNRRFIYLDGSWTSQNRVLMFLEWTKHAVLGVFRATRYFPVKTAIVLAEASDCHPNVAIDWRLVWDINRYRNAKSAKQIGPKSQAGA